MAAIQRLFSLIRQLKWRVPAGLLALLLMAGCTTGTANPPPQDDPVAPTAASSAPSESTAESDPTEIPATPTPDEPFPDEGPWEVTFETVDGVSLSGTLYGKTGETGIVLAPTYPGSQSGWAGFAPRLAEAGYRALTFDFRGHGASAGEPDITQASADIEAALSFLREQETERMMLVGAGEGGTAVLKFAAVDSEIVGVAVVGAPREFEGLSVTDAELAVITVPTLWLATRLDLFQDVEAMSALAGSADNELWIYEGSSLHGTYIFEGSDASDMTQRLLAFVERVAGDN